jgi:hypothetical protein
MSRRQWRSVKPKSSPQSAWSRALDGFDLYPERLIGDSAYGSAEMLNWLVHDPGIEPHIPVFDKSPRTGTFSRNDFTYDYKPDCCICPVGKDLRQYRQQGRAAKAKPPVDGLYRYRSSQSLFE